MGKVGNFSPLIPTVTNKIINLDPGAQRRSYITMTHFWAFRLFEQIHDVQGREPTTILRGGRLLQQLVVDCWAAAEQLNLRWLRTHQATI